MAKIDIFISSAIESLKKEREMVAAAINGRKVLNAVFAEDLPAHDDPPIEICKRKVQSCHMYVGIFDKEWGYIPKKANPRSLSMTAMEYYWAKEKGLPKFIFISKIENIGRGKSLETFLNDIRDVQEGHWVKTYNDNVHLRELVLAAVDTALVEKYHSGDRAVNAIPVDGLRIIDNEKRKRDTIVRSLLAEASENELKSVVISKNSLHQFDTDVWNTNKGELYFLGSGDRAILEISYVELKEKNNYLEGIINARDTNTEIKWTGRYADKESLQGINSKLKHVKKLLTDYLEVSGTYPQI